MARMSCANQVSSLYKTVVDDVISSVKEAFLDDGVDEQILLELKQLWENKLTASKALERQPEPEIRLTSPAVGLLLNQSQKSSEQFHQSYISRGAVQQPQQQTFLSSSQPQLTGAAAQATMALPMGLIQQQLAALGATGQGSVTLQPTGNGQYIAVQNIRGQQATIAIPPQALLGQPAVLTQQVTAKQAQSGIIQLDGAADGSSSSEDEDIGNDDDEDNEEELNEEEAEEGEEEEPLNSADDVSEEDPNELFEADNVIVCQYDKIHRNKSKWKFHLKDGIMNLNGKDFIFQRSTGDADW